MTTSTIYFTVIYYFSSRKVLPHKYLTCKLALLSMAGNRCTPHLRHVFLPLWNKQQKNRVPCLFNYLNKNNKNLLPAL